MAKRSHASKRYPLCPSFSSLVTVRPMTPGDNFKGILLTAKTEGSNVTVGTWSTTDANLQTLNCGGAAASTGITHRTRDAKTQASATWIAPSTLSGGNIVIRYESLLLAIHSSLTYV